MDNTYGLYKKARNASWKTLIDCRVESLPVSTLKICRHYNIALLDSVNDQSFARFFAIDTPSIHGAALQRCGRWYILFDGSLSHTRIRFTIAHELGHILLGHRAAPGQFLSRVNHGDFSASERDPMERSADMFAARLLAPACVLKGLDLHTPQEIIRTCDISLTAATIRAKRMAILYERQRFFTDPLEWPLYSQFHTFISNNK